MTIGKKFNVASNPAKKKRRAPAKKRKNATAKHRHRATAKRRKNAATAANPKHRKRASMAKKKRATTKKRRRATPRRKAANPTKFARKRTYARSRRRRKASNPSIRRSLSGGSGFLKNGAIAAVGLAATRQLPQMLLKEGNTGYMGYAANLVAAFIASFAAKKIAGQQAGQMALIGGACYLVTRILTEKFSPIGQYLSLTGVGDASAATNLGTIEDSYYTHPAVYEGGQPVIPYQITEAARAGMMPAPAANMAGIGFARSAYA